MRKLHELRSSEVFLTVEHALYVALGAILSITALAALVDVAHTLWDALADWNGSYALLATTDRLLFVLMLAEILHTVRVSIKSGALTCEPFLIIGLIACIRRVLVITLETAQPRGGAADSGSQGLFQSSMIELGVLGTLILVMVISIYLVRRASDGEGTVSTGLE
jgi:uncharacterized membrane protein (DUF373 family)